MTREEFKKLIGFECRKDDFGNTSIVGGVVFKSVMTISKHYAGNEKAVEMAKDQIREEILRKVYDDKRKEFYEKIVELEMCNPTDFSKWISIVREIMDMARAL